MQPGTTQFKRCPKCGQPAVLDLQICSKCGHIYSTKFPTKAPSPVQPPQPLARAQQMPPLNQGQTYGQPYNPSAYPGQLGQSNYYPPQPQAPYQVIPPKPRTNWTPWAIVLGSIIIISPCLFLGFSCALSEAAMANKPPASTYLSGIRMEMSQQSVEDKFGPPDSTQHIGNADTWYYDSQDGTIQVNFFPYNGGVESVNKF